MKRFLLSILVFIVFPSAMFIELSEGEAVALRYPNYPRTTHWCSYTFASKYGYAGCYIKSMYFCVCNKKIEGWVMIKTKQEIKSVSNKMN